MAIKKISSSNKATALHNDLIPEKNKNSSPKEERETKTAESFSLEESLEKEKSRFSYCLKTKKLELVDKIKESVLAYNQVIYQILRLEEQHGFQYDQYIQHFLMSNHLTFIKLGINIQHSVYLEFNKPEIRDAIVYYSEKKVKDKLFADDGIFFQLLSVIETTIEKIQNNQLQFGKSGRNFDFKG